MDDKRIRHDKVTFTVVLVMTCLVFALALYGTGEGVTLPVYACLIFPYATACFVVWRI